MAVCLSLRFDFGWLEAHREEAAVLISVAGPGQSPVYRWSSSFKRTALRVRQAVRRATAWLPHIGVEASRVATAPVGTDAPASPSVAAGT